ncbi:hypothetical protein F503_07117 [Ophiostoma piceae UAMH 11346]|uniref:WW domain-containing protein n=1 Tax=Ophiostoma piceae (strain UAMH 11346) TaxID=1262450 RepID=S3CBK7_OPHP1|nr:hypothetical protein F503_07117 [Ophiostoma piceae UAMH 11346]
MIGRRSISIKPSPGEAAIHPAPCRDGVASSLSSNDSIAPFLSNPILDHKSGMSRQDGPSSRHPGGSLRSDDTTYEYYKTYNDYARSRRSPSPSKEPKSTSGAKDAKMTRSQSRASRISHHDDLLRPRAFNDESHSLCDSSDDSSNYGEITPRSSSRGRPSSTTSRGGPSIRSIKSPRAALNRFNTNIRRSPIPESPELSRDYKTPKGRPPLPPGWSPQFSAPHGRWFYYNKATGNSQWEAPGFEDKTLRGILSNKADSGGRLQVDDDDEGTKNSRGQGGGRGRDSGGGGGGGDHRGRLGGGKGSGSSRYAQPHRENSSLGTACLLLSIAGGIAAGTLLARGLQSKPSRMSMSESTVRRKKSNSSFSD